MSRGSQQGCGLRGIWRGTQKADNVIVLKLWNKLLSLSEESKSFEERYNPMSILKSLFWLQYQEPIDEGLEHVCV